MANFLIADDNDGKVVMMTMIIKKSGLTADILRAKSTDEAKQLIDENEIAYAFVDYEMPTEDGPAVIAYLLENQPKSRVAMVSSGNSERYKNDAALAGAECFICTSLQSDEVERAILDILEEWKGDFA